MTVRWLSKEQEAAWLRLVAVTELLPGVLDSQLRRDSGLTFFEYSVLAMLSEVSDNTLRMTSLARSTNATLTRLSHVIRRMEERDLVERFPCPQDGRATNVRLTAEGWRTLRGAAPNHVETVREHVIDALTPEQLQQVHEIGDALLSRLDPEGALRGMYGDLVELAG